MRFHFVRTAKKIGECRKPKFLVLKRRWLTLGAAVLAAAGVFAAVKDGVRDKEALNGKCGARCTDDEH